MSTHTRQDDLIPLTEAAEKVGITREYMRQLIHAEKVEYKRIGKFYFLYRREVERLLNNRRETGKPLGKK